MKKKWVAFFGSGVLVICLVFTNISFANSDHSKITNGTLRIDQQSEAEFPAMAKISINQAIQNALKSTPGQVLKTELENENSFLVYGIEVATADKTIVEVKIDAGSGEVLATIQDKADHEDNDQDEDHDHED